MGASSKVIYNAAALQLAKQVDNLNQIDHVMYVLPVSIGQYFGPAGICIRCSTSVPQDGTSFSAGDPSTSWVAYAACKCLDFSSSGSYTCITEDFTCKLEEVTLCTITRR